MTALAALWRELAEENRQLAAATLFSEPFTAMAERCERHADALDAERPIRWEEADDATT